MEKDDFSAEDWPEFPDEESEGSMSMTRRSFIGSVMGSTLAATAAGDENAPDVSDEADLDFVWTTTDDDRQVLEIRIIKGMGLPEKKARKARLAAQSEKKDKQKVKDTFAEIKPGDPSGDHTWRLSPESFGPEAKFILRNSLSGGLRTYEIRVANVRYGRLRGRELRITFTQKEVQGHKPEGRETLQLEFLVSVYTTIWSRSQNATSQKAFRLSAHVPEPSTGKTVFPVRFREFLEGDVELAEIISTGRISSTMRLMMNGLIDHAGGAGEVNLRLSFTHRAEWVVQGVRPSSAPCMTGISGKVRLRRLRLFWLERSVEQTEDQASLKDINATFMGEAEAVLESAGPITVNTNSGPGLSVRPATKLRKDADQNDQKRQEYDAGQILFRIDAPSGGKGKTRAEAMWKRTWSNLLITGAADEAAGPFPTLTGSFLERVEAPAAANNDSAAQLGGSLSFQASYPKAVTKNDSDTTAGAPIRLKSPIGSFSATGVRFADDTEAGSAISFPIRRGQPVLMLFDWDNHTKSGGSRKKPVAQWIEGAVSITDTDIALKDAEYSRLSFAPSELQLIYSREPLPDRPIRNYILLGAPKNDEIARLDLSRATLRASRSHSLLSLVFRFSDLALAFTGKSREIVRFNDSCLLRVQEGVAGRLQPHDMRPTIVVEFPGQHLFEEAKFLPGLPPMPDVNLKQMLIVDVSSGKITEKPELIFGDGKPGQYVKGYVEDKESITFNPDNRAQVADVLIALQRTARLEFRERLREIKSQQPTKSGEAEQKESPAVAAARLSREKDYEEFNTFASSFYKKVKNILAAAKLPEEQYHYIGPYALDVDAMHLARKLFKETVRNALTALITQMFSSVLNRAGKISARLDRAATGFDRDLKLETRIEAAVPTYQLFRIFYRDTMAASFADPKGGEMGAALAAKSLSPPEVEFLSSQISSGATGHARFAHVKRLFIEVIKGQDNVSGPVRARLANPSRLAFRVNCRDGIETARAGIKGIDNREDEKQRQPRAKFEFGLDDLTNFRGLELAVTRRAEIIYDPGLLGQIDSGRPRIINPSPGAMLDRLGFSQGPYITTAQRLSEVASSLTPPTAFETAIEIPARLILSPHQNAVVLTPTNNDHSDLYDLRGNGQDTQLPTRLWTVDFMTGSTGNGLDPGMRAVHSPDLRPDFVWQRWHQNQKVDSVGGDTPFRVPGGAAPPRGPFAPWYLARHDTLRGSPNPKTISTAEDISDAQFCEDVKADPKKRLNFSGMILELCKSFVLRSHKEQLDLYFRGPTDAYMRHELVLLSSAWGLPVLGRRSEDRDLIVGSSQLEPEARHRLADLQPGSAIYRPRTLNVSELSLSSLGGTFRHDTGFEPPAAALWLDGRSLYDAFSIERWQQWTNLGRDIYCEVVFKGFLFPLGLRASLVQVTERNFFVEQGSGRITATLRQRMFIRAADPERAYPAIKQPFEGRHFPVNRLKLLTSTTPDIVDPNDPANLEEVKTTTPRGSGRIDFPDGTGLVFWPRTARIQEANIRFEMEIDGVRTDIPLIFVDNTAANDATVLGKITDYYNTLASPEHGTPNKVPGTDEIELDYLETSQVIAFKPQEHVRTMNLAGAKLRYASELESGTASFETEHWTLRASGAYKNRGEIKSKDGEIVIEQYTPNNTNHTFGSFLSGADQPPFYPAVDTARLRLSQTERLVGSNLPSVRAHFDARYLVYGFAQQGPSEPDVSDQTTDRSVTGLPAENPSEIFMVLRDQIKQNMKDKGSQSGGVFRPEGAVAALSRKKGVMTRGAIVELDKTSGAKNTLFSMSELFYAPPRTSVQTSVTGSDIYKPPATDTEAAGIDEALNKIKGVYKDFFSDDAKILGLVKVRDLFDLIRDLSAPEEGLPQLKEAIEFGGAAGAAAQTVRENIVAPLATASRAVRETWDRIEKSLAENQERLPGVIGPPITVAEVFPELNSSLTDLTRALSKAEKESDEFLFALELGACYSAGQRFLNAVERSAANPFDRVENALRQKFDTALALFRSFQGNEGAFLQALLVGEIQKALGIPDGPVKLRKWAEGKAKNIVTVLLPTKAENGAWRRLGAVDLPGTEVFLQKDELNKKYVQLFGFAADDLHAILKAFVTYSLVDIIHNAPDIPDIDTLAKGFLKVRKDQAGWIDFGKPKVAADKIQAAIEDGLASLKKQLKKNGQDPYSLNNALFDKIELEMGKLLAAAEAKSNAELIRNRYLICLLLALKDTPDFSKAFPDTDLTPLLKGILSFIRALLRDTSELTAWLLEQIGDVLKVIGDVLRALGQIVSAISNPLDLRALIQALRDMLEPLELPSIPTADACTAFDTAWQPTRIAMHKLAVLGETAYLCPPSSKLPQFLLDGPQELPEIKKIDWAKEQQHLCGLLYRGHEIIRALKATISDQKLGEKLVSFKGAAEEADVPTGQEQKKSAFILAISKMINAVNATDDWLAGLQRMLNDGYLLGLKDAQALRTLNQNLAAAAQFDPCKTDADGKLVLTTSEIEEQILAILALKNLPRDFRRFTEQRSAFIEALAKTQGAIVAKVQSIVDNKSLLVLPLAAGIFEMMQSKGFLAPGDKLKVPDWFSGDKVQDAFDEVVEVLEETQDDITSLTTRIAEILCQGIAAANDLSVQLEDLFQDFRSNHDYALKYLPTTEIDTALGQIKEVNARLQAFKVELKKITAGNNNSGGGQTATPINLGDLAAVSLDGKTLSEVLSFSKVGDKPGLLQEISQGQANVTDRLVSLVKPLQSYLDLDPRKAVLELLDPVAASILKTDLSVSLGGPASGAGQNIADLYYNLSEKRDALDETLNSGAFLGISVGKNLFVLSDDARGPVTNFTPATEVSKLGPGVDTSYGNDQLWGDVAWLNKSLEGPPLSNEKNLAFLSEFVREWSRGTPTPILILDQMTDLVDDILKGEIYQLIDFKQLREAFEDYLLSLLPSRIRMSYDFDLPLGSAVKAATGGIFAPGPGTALNIAMQMVVDLNLGKLIEGSGKPQVNARSTGTLGPFDINLVGDIFDALTLKFSGAKFEAATGQKPRFDIEYDDYVIGPELSFLEDLQRFLSPKDGSGAYVTFNPFLPGVEAGYRLMLGDFSVGNMAFTNVSLEASAILPFSDSEALFKASLSSRMSPFTLTYAPYGGSGFFAIYANPGGIIGFEASFEFGGSVVFAYGPLTGQGRLMAGVYIRQMKVGGQKITEMSMTFFVGGSAAIWIFSFGCALSVKLGSVNGNMTGQATFTYGFSIGIKDFEFSVTVEKEEEKGFNGQSSYLGNGPVRFAGLGALNGETRPTPDAHFKTDTRCQGQDWRTYQTYFKDNELPEGYF